MNLELKNIFLITRFTLNNFLMLLIKNFSQVSYLIKFLNKGLHKRYFGDKNPTFGGGYISNTTSPSGLTKSYNFWIESYGDGVCCNTPLQITTSNFSFGISFKKSAFTLLQFCSDCATLKNMA